MAKEYWMSFSWVYLVARATHVSIIDSQGEGITPSRTTENQMNAATLINELTSELTNDAHAVAYATSDASAINADNYFLPNELDAKPTFRRVTTLPSNEDEALQLWALLDYHGPEGACWYPVRHA